MNLMKYLDQHVEVTTTQGEIIKGIATDYMYPEDNNPQKESIIIETTNEDLIEIFTDEIKKIEVSSI